MIKIKVLVFEINQLMIEINYLFIEINESTNQWLKIISQMKLII